MSGDGIQNPYDDTALVAAVAVIDTEVGLIQEDVDAIEAIVEAEAILEEAGGYLTTDDTEQTIYINNAPGGVFVPKTLIIDFTNQTVAETVILRVSYRIVPAGAWVIEDSETIVGIPVNAGIMIQLHEARYGIWITIEKTVGDNWAYDWEVFYEV